jgi:integrase
VEPPDVRRFIAKLEADGLAPSSIRKEVAPLRAMLATAFEDGAIRSNPAVGVRISGRRGDEEEEHAKALTPEELSSLLAELPEPWRLFFEFLAHTGLRVSEAIGLTWADGFGEQPRLRLRRQYCRGEWQRLKSSYSRRDVPLSTGMARKLWAIRRGRRATDPVFTSSNGMLLREENLRRRVLQPAAERAGVPWVGFHAFRHTCASLLFGGGRNVKQVQEWLGHADPGFTMRTYIHLIDGRQEGADFLDEQVVVGNAWATEGPQTAAKEEALRVANLAQ